VIQPGQTYTSCHPLDEARRIRIETYRPGDVRAHIVDADTGKRFRQILVSTLHDSNRTKSGAPRRSGYALDQP